MARSSPFEITCAICNKPVDITTTKTNDRGKAVHEECYVQQALKDATRPTTSRLHLET
jgi:hypothetical protein